MQGTVTASKLGFSRPQRGNGFIAFFGGVLYIYRHNSPFVRVLLRSGCRDVAKTETITGLIINIINLQIYKLNVKKYIDYRVRKFTLEVKGYGNNGTNTKV